MGECVLLSLVPVVIGALVMAGFYVFVFAAAVVTRGGVLGKAFSFLGSIGVGLVMAFLFAALIRVFLKIARGQQTSIGEMFAPDAGMWPAAVTAFAFQLMMSLGIAIFVVPGFFVLTIFFPCVALAVDRRLAVGDAFTAAAQMTAGNRLMLFAIWLVATIGANIVIGLTCGLGALVAVPFLVLLYAVIYLTLAGEPTAK